MSFTKTILEGIKYWGDKKFAKVQSDLESKQPVGDYVLKEEVPVTSVNGQTGDVSLALFSGSYNDLTDKTHGVISPAIEEWFVQDYEFVIPLGQSTCDIKLNKDVDFSYGLIVVYGNITYICEPQREPTFNTIYFGNGSYIMSSLPDNDMPFALRVQNTNTLVYFRYPSNDYGSFQSMISIGQSREEVVKTLDEKFIPDTIARVDDINTPKTEFILNSSTEGSTKKFKLTIDDDGVLTTTEIVVEEG